MKLNKWIFNASYILSVILLSSMAHAATVSGIASYEGKVPKFPSIKMDADPICVAKNDGDVFPQALVLGEENTMANVFVHVISGLEDQEYTLPEEPAIITQAGCMYDPHVLGVMTGQPVKILNPDGTLHNVHALSKVNDEFNLAMPKFRKETMKTFDKEEFMFQVKCDVHPWMNAWVAVMPHPYFAVSALDGSFSIENLPAGTYEVEAWHEKLGTKTMSITVADADVGDVNFTFSRPSKQEITKIPKNKSQIPNKSQ